MFSRNAGRQAAPTRAGSESVEIEENIGALERARHFGVSKLSLQRLVFVNELVDCAHEIGYDATITHLLPLVQKLASDPEVLVRQSLVSHIGDLAGFLIQSDPELGAGFAKVVESLLPTVKVLLREKGSDVRQGAADALTTLASHLRSYLQLGQRGEKVLMTVIDLAHSDDDEDARTTAVQLFNSLAEALGPNLCQQFVCIELVSMSQDRAFRVRKAVASNLAEVGRIVGEEYVLRRLVPAFSQLVSDAHWGVRKAASESLVSLAMTLPSEKRQDGFLPLVKELLKDQTRWVKMAALQQLGYFIACLEEADRVPMDLLETYIEAIQDSKANPDAADISFHCAYTFAAVTRTMGKSSWSMLKASFLTLCSDSQLKTRKAMAASVHIVAQTLGSALTEQEVLPQFESFLQDSSAEVRQAALKVVSQILRVTSRNSAQRRGLKALQTGMSKADSWRLRQLAASQLGPICASLVAGDEPLGSDKEDSVEEAGQSAPSEGEGSSSPSRKKAAAKDMTWSVVVPLFLQLCGDAVAQVRDAAAMASAGILQAAVPELFVDPSTCGVQEEGSSGCSGQLQAGTNHLVRHLVRTFARARSFRNRMVYIRMCDSIIREAPMHVFTDLFMRPLIRLSLDRVKNVRLLWALMVLPHLRKVGRLGQNKLVIAAATRLLRNSEAPAQGKESNPSDPEVASLLRAANLPDVSEEELAALPGPESDLDDSDAGDGPLATEGGTGDSSECSDVGVLESDSVEEQEQEPCSTEEAAAGRGLQIQVEGADKDAVASTSTSSPEPVQAKPPSPQAPKSPQQTASLPLGHDAVEDGLVEQMEMEREMDAAFSDRRLLAEAEAADPAELGMTDASARAGYSQAAEAAPAASPAEKEEQTDQPGPFASTLEETAKLPEPANEPS
eukprot:TRINITY_DN62332_c0_g1_i1.p1 TRINITY_DN62332_c0_g1~~TRINITY_DN62332_c0_g1_i1.p1  ORF type:complete len:941 (+),score=215.22 TRINITY_DN62332_c0_g1_i1:121-2823(+)